MSDQPDLSASPKGRLWARAGRGVSPGLVLALCAAALAGCASPPARYAGARGQGGRAYDARLGVTASPRLYEDGDVIPRGGGQYLVGRPYTVAGRVYYPRERPEGYTAVGTASWYGDAFHGRRTANGEIFDMRSISAAHPTLPLPSYVRVTNLGNGYSMIVRVNDRGPYHGGRVMDVSQRVADALDFRRAGTARIKIEYVGKASLGGSDDEKLLATLKTDGGQPSLDGGDSTVVASEETPPLPSAPTSPPILRPVAQALTLTEGDGENGDAAPPVRRLRAPVPPQRPFEVGYPEQRAEVSDVSRQPRRSSPAAPSTTPLISFGSSDAGSALLPRAGRGRKPDLPDAVESVD